MNLAKAFSAAMSFLLSVVSLSAAAESFDGLGVETLSTPTEKRTPINTDSQNIQQVSQQHNDDHNEENTQELRQSSQEPIGLASQGTSWSGVGAAQVNSPQVASRPYTWYREGRAGWGKRDLYLSPMISLFLPGFDQWWEGQYAAGSLYTGSKILAHRATQKAKSNFLNSEDVERINREIEKGMETQSNDVRKIYLFSQVQLATGGLSLYHAFRTAVESRPQDFSFIVKKETFSELMLAPFDLTHFLKPTTYIPLAGLAGLFLAENASQRTTSDSKYRAIKLGGDDLLFSSMFSYNAGTYEEMVFRGWLQPLVYYETQSKLTANLANSVVFALAHRNNVKVPIIQMGLGYYLGWLTMENSWSLSESIFVHAWWDLLAFLQSYHYERKNPGTQAYWLPGINLAL